MNFFRNRFFVTIISLLSLMMVIAVVSFNLGTVTLSPNEIFQTIMGQGTERSELVLFRIRLPAIVLAILVGIAMALSGVVLQAITRNDLADPGILGINSGAGLAVVIYISFFDVLSTNLPTFGIFLMPIIAFSGAMITAVLILMLSWRGDFQSMRLILVGIAINAGLSAGLIYFQLRLEPQDFMRTTVWLSGDLWAAQWPYVLAVLPWFAVLVPFVMFKAKQLNILNLHDDLARGLGLNVNMERLIMLFAGVALAGIGVSVGGGIAFLGLIAPHLARRMVGPDHHFVLPTAALVGALILLLSDTLGKNLLAQIEIPAGLIVSIISVPYFIYLLLRVK
ncbi:FecCD family ABC transporter permease [Jeotgalibacillus soli]|uniref:Iron ABC transporter permease n=1 Tax=Jeotgalibacillus soli TaxID=889306 RepID=A0A0C2VIG7_9BACL|nr:iron ABC transporter permease [Jeotgalibacillus soli]KIL44296.1 iron ABC transporter permease [Jeotgalibacillus soli]